MNRKHPSTTGVWLKHGDHQAKLYSVDYTRFDEPMIFPPARSGGHVTMHESGVLKASDHHGLDRRSSWRPRRQQLQRAFDLLSYTVADDAMLVSIPSIGTGFLQQQESGDVIVDLEQAIEDLSNLTVHLVTRRLIDQHGLDIGSRFLDLGRMAVIELLDSDGTAVGLPLDAEERGRLLSEVPLLGPFTDLLQATMDHASELKAAGAIKSPKQEMAIEAISEAAQEQIQATDWSKVRFIDHVRGRIYRVANGEIEESAYDG